MDINSAFNSGLQALQRADVGLKRNAETIANNTGRVEGSEDIHTALVESLENRQLAKVGTRVIAAADEATGTLIDLKV
jgi:hypothetical protein